MIAIDDDIPPPGISSRKRFDYPFARMKVGSSFLMPNEPNRSSNNLQCAVGMAAKRYGIRVKTMSVEGGVRVWRVA